VILEIIYSINNLFIFSVITGSTKSVICYFVSATSSLVEDTTNPLTHDVSDTPASVSSFTPIYWLN